MEMIIVIHDRHQCESKIVLEVNQVRPKRKQKIYIKKIGMRKKRKKIHNTNLLF